MPRSLYVSGSMLTGLEGFAAYRYVHATGTLTRIDPFVAAPTYHNHYEVSVPDDTGSWWIPIGTHVPHVWAVNGGHEAIAGIGNTTANELRPSQVFFWIPAASLAGTNWVPGHAPGAVTGNHPPNAPA